MFVLIIYKQNKEMKMKKKNQKGSATIVIVIILALGLIGTVSYFAWQKLTANKETVAIETDQSEQTEDDFISNSDIDVHDVNSSDTTTTTNPIPTTNTPAVTNTKTGNENFPITQWGVTGYYSGTHQVSYNIYSPNNLGFRSDDLVGTCAAESNIGVINRRTGDQLMSTVGEFAFDNSNSNKTVAEFITQNSQTTYPNKHIGQYYYFLISPQASCFTAINHETLDHQIYMDIVNYFNTLVAI